MGVYTGGDDVGGWGPFFKQKAVKNIITGEVHIASAITAWHDDLVHKGAQANWSDYERGFIGWDGKYYKQATLDKLAAEWVQKNGYPQSWHRISFSKNAAIFESLVAKFHVIDH